MNLSLSTMWWGEEEADCFEWAGRTRELGLTAVELEYRRSAAGLPRLRRALAEYELRVSSLHAPFPRPEDEGDPLQLADLAAEDEEARRYAEHLVARTLEEAAHWGAGVVVLHAGNIRSLHPLEGELAALYRAGRKDGEFRRLWEELRRGRFVEAPRRLEWVREALGRLAVRARDLGVVIGLENRADYRDLPSPEEMGLLLEEFGPEVGFWYDVGHAYRLEALGFYPQAVWLERYGGRLVGVHLHDSRGLSDHRPPGTGEVPFGRLLPLLPAQGLRVLEVQHGYRSEELSQGLDVLRAAGVLA
ncbi:MAG: sugar phosphate isomerase/epimerase family protein [Chloroflexia bacterium]